MDSYIERKYANLEKTFAEKVTKLTEAERSVRQRRDDNLATIERLKKEVREDENQLSTIESYLKELQDMHSSLRIIITGAREGDGETIKKMDEDTGAGRSICGGGRS